MFIPRRKKNSEVAVRFKPKISKKIILAPIIRKKEEKTTSSPFERMKSIPVEKIREILCVENKLKFENNVKQSIVLKNELETKEESFRHHYKNLM